MQIDKEAIEEFIQLYEEEFGVRLTPDEAQHVASTLVELYVRLKWKAPGTETT